MNKELMVTIGCITYNQEKYIAEAIESFLAQKVNFNYEIIINDDASTDNTANIIREYEKKYPTIIRGIYQTENQYSKGIITSQIVRNQAKGKYIAFCEGDDFWTDNSKLQRQVDFLEENPEYIATGHWCDVVDEKSKKSDAFKNSDMIFNFKKQEYTLNDYKKDIIPAHMNTIMHRNFYLEKKYDYNEMYKASNMIGDRTSYLILTLLGRINIDHRKMSCYRYVTQGGSSYSAQVKGKNKFYDWYMYYSRLEELTKKVFNKKINLIRLRFNVLVSAFILYKRNKSDENKRILDKIFNKIPKKEYIYIPVALINRIESNIKKKI